MIRDVLSYLYVNAKVMAKEGKLISPAKWEDLWGCESPAEITSLLEGTDYFPFLSERAASSSRELENSLLEEFFSLSREISHIIHKRAWPIREYLLKRWDLINVRTVLRGAHGGLKKEEIVDLLAEEGELGLPFLKDLMDAEDMDSLVSLLAKTPYHSLAGGLAQYNETRNLFFLEALLDRAFWEDLWKKTLEAQGLKDFKDFIEVNVDTHNRKIVLRAKKDKLSLEDINPFLIGECSLMNEITPDFDEEDVPGLISLLEGTEYFEPLVSAQPQDEGTGSLASLEDALNDLVAKKAAEIRKKKPFGQGPLIGFLVSKETEINRLLAVVRSTEVNMDRGMIRESLTRQ